MELTFFGSTRDRMRGLVVKEGLIIPLPDDKPLLRQLAIVSEGKVSIDPIEYDAFIVYGLLFRVPALDSRWSEAVSLATCRDAFHSSAASYVVSLVRSVSNSKRILVGPVPLKSPRAARPSIPLDKLTSYESSAAFVAEAVAESGVEFVPQKAETVGEGWTTKEAYSQGAISLIGGKDVGSGDTLHMNGRFGETCIREFMARLV